ncbi:unnamed protein product [Brassica oleracea]
MDRDVTLTLTTRQRSSCGGTQGGTISRPSCFIRWEVYPLLDLFDDITPEKAVDDITTSGSLQFEFKAIEAATSNFHNIISLGTFPSATQVALKRLTKTSGQDEEEFMNELIYERIFSSLPDPKKNSQLDWSKRYNIMEGITCRILYLHQDSRLTIIHCDLEACNILLDEDLNP